MNRKQRQKRMKAERQRMAQARIAKRERISAEAELTAIEANMTYERNHEPEQAGEWFPYTGFRFKELYDIRLHDGVIIREVRPNANAWHLWGAPAPKPYAFRNRFRDAEVAEVRLRPNAEQTFPHATEVAFVKFALRLFPRGEYPNT